MVIGEFAAVCSGGMTSQQLFNYAYTKGYQVTPVHYHHWTCYEYCFTGRQFLAIQCRWIVFGHASHSEGRNVSPERLEWSRRTNQFHRGLNSIRVKQSRNNFLFFTLLDIGDWNQYVLQWQWVSSFNLSEAINLMLIVQPQTKQTVILHRSHLIHV